MKTEYETKILNIDPNKIQEKLKQIGAKYIQENLQKRYIYDFNPKCDNKWIRLRQKGKITELTIKEIIDDSIIGTKELEIQVSDFDTTNLILEKLGYTHKLYQENKRISYKLDSVEIEIDFWPLIPVYIEIEGKNKEEVYEVVKKLGYKISDTTSINTIKIYQEHSMDLQKIKNLTFKTKL